MKKTIFVLLLLLPLWLSAQTQSSAGINLSVPQSISPGDSLRMTMSKAGMELTKFYKAYTIGTAMGVTGTVMVVVGASTQNSSKSGDALIGIGTAVGIAGLFVTIASYAHIKRAGLILQGNQIAMPIGVRRIKR